MDVIIARFTGPLNHHYYYVAPDLAAVQQRIHRRWSSEKLRSEVLSTLVQVDFSVMEQLATKHLDKFRMWEERVEHCEEYGHAWELGWVFAQAEEVGR